MELKGIQRAASLLGASVLAIFIWHGSARLMVAGALYLVAASWLGILCLLQINALRTRQRQGPLESIAWLLRTKAHVFLLSAWQMAILGLLNVLAANFTGPATAAIILGYVAVGLFFVLSYQMIGLSDRTEQYGGSKPLRYFGRPRSRRLIFCALLLYPLTPLIMISVAWRNWKWCPTLLRPPQCFLLLVSMSSALSAAMVFQRYRQSAQDRALAVRLLVFTLSVLGPAAAIQVLFDYNGYVYALSSITLICIAVTGYWLSLAKEGGTADAGSPDLSSNNCSSHTSSST